MQERGGEGGRERSGREKQNQIGLKSSSNCRISLQRDGQKDDTQDRGERNKRRVVAELRTSRGRPPKVLQAFNDIEFSGSPRCHRATNSLECGVHSVIDRRVTLSRRTPAEACESSEYQHEASVSSPPRSTGLKRNSLPFF